METATLPVDSTELLQESIHGRTGQQVDGLTLVVVPGQGVILEGQAGSYYVKQIAQHVAVTCVGLRVVANHIQVRPRRREAWSALAN